MRDERASNFRLDVQFAIKMVFESSEIVKFDLISYNFINTISIKRLSSEVVESLPKFLKFFSKFLKNRSESFVPRNKYIKNLKFH